MGWDFIHFDLFRINLLIASLNLYSYNLKIYIYLYLNLPILL
jgi:hypothetical protein